MLRSGEEEGRDAHTLPGRADPAVRQSTLALGGDLPAYLGLRVHIPLEVQRYLCIELLPFLTPGVAQGQCCNILKGW
jgi:hypothetical protein